MNIGWLNTIMIMKKKWKRKKHFCQTHKPEVVESKVLLITVLSPISTKRNIATIFKVRLFRAQIIINIITYKVILKNNFDIDTSFV